MKTKVNSVELFMYFCVWIFAALYSLYKLYHAQNEIFQSNKNLLHNLSGLKSGWRFVSRMKDVSDIEWNSWKYFIQKSWCYFIIQFIISEIIRNTAISLLKYWYIISSVVFILLYMTIRQLIIVSIQPTLYILIIYLGGRKLSLWVTSIVLIIFYNSLKYKHFFWTFLDRHDLQDEEVYITLFCIAWIQMKCISFSIDYIEKNEKLDSIKDKKSCGNSITFETIVNISCYILYLPLLYVGPVVLYEDFEKSFYVKNERLLLKLRKFTWDMFLFLVYSFLLDYALHYMYFFAMQNEMELIRQLPTLALSGGGLWMGLEFYMKYIIAYGTTTAFARLDNMEPPPTPRCIARIHLYSQMWRHFDVGLYKFLVKYIYRPGFNTISTKLKLSKIYCKLLASLATFIFIFLWHGTFWNIFLWSVLNYMGIALEHLGKEFSKSEKYQCFKKKILKTENMETRVVALACVPLVTLSAISNIYLFAGSDVGNLYFEYVAQPTLWTSMIWLVSLYSCCHVCIALEDVPSRTDVKTQVVK